jgi:hypothetical protein
VKRKLNAAAPRDEERAPAPAAADKTARAPEKRERSVGLAQSEDAAARDRFAELQARVPGSLAEARGLREAWREQVAHSRDAVRADETRVRVVRGGLEAYRLGGAVDDLALLRPDAAAYLERSDARKRDRVRSWLRTLPAE